MKLLLASQGFLTDEIAQEVERVVGKSLKEINIGIINESYFELDREKDKRWVINELSCLEKYIGIPHYMRKGREQWNEDFLKRTLKDEKFPIYAINDNQMISYVDGEINFIGGTPSMFGSF